MVFVRQDGPSMVKLPTGLIRHMTPLETELEAVEGISLQQLNQPIAEVVGRVSVVTPTTASRARFHPQLWQCFVNQSWPDKELVVVETYHDEPSAFFESIARVDNRLKYVAIKRPVGEDLTVGAKRNATILLASGQYIVNFDDDDLYADRYVEHMVTPDAAEKLGGPDPLRLAQLLRSKRHCRIFGTQFMGPRGSGRNG